MMYIVFLFVLLFKDNWVRTQLQQDLYIELYTCCVGGIDFEQK